ncbi:hypothetical protein BC629DRAFT_1587828 [Irpex lacteus]|nr:hypothetical protein BC629DRAFT_1587828 [Irpex lacteus]
MATNANDAVVGTEYNIQSILTKKSIDFDFSNGTGSRKLHQWETFDIPNQIWTLESADHSTGYIIRHVQTGFASSRPQLAGW